MFERDLQRRLERIFGLSKTTFAAPNVDTPEQDTLFVTINGAKSRTGGNVATQTARVSGVLTVFSQAMLEGKATDEDDKAVRLPYGYFAKRIAKAAQADVAPFFFEDEQDISGSPARMQNLHERQVPFTFLYSAQYDPDRGELNEVHMTVDTSLEE